MAKFDAVVVGGGHNGLTAAAYLAKAGKSVLVLERREHVGGAAVSERPFAGVDAQLSRYAYLVSLLPRQIVNELNLPLTLRRRRYSSYTPVGDDGLLVDHGAPSGNFPELAAWQERCASMAQRLWPTVTAPLMPRDEMRSLVGDDELWHEIFDQPIGHAIASRVDDDVMRGVVATDALIGTFADVDDASLVQNRCFLYHVIGNGTGDWDVPVGGMGSVTKALADSALAAGAEIVTRATVTNIDPAGEVEYRDESGAELRVGAGHIVAGCSPSMLAYLLGDEPPAKPEGSQLKINMLLHRLPRLRSDVDPAAAFNGTFHVNESFTQLRRAYEQARSGSVPDVPPCEIYCHTLSDRSILGPDLRDSTVQTLTLFGLHMPERLFRVDNEATRREAVAATLASLNSVLAEPIEDCLMSDAGGRPCLEARTPVDLEHELGLPGGHIFHGDLDWPFAATDDEVGRWGVETAYPRVLLCGAGAKRGGGVSGIPGRAAAMSVLATAAD